MNGGEAFDMLDKYNLRQDADRECKRRKLDEAPYDMMGHNKVYSEFLIKKWREIRDRVAEKQKSHCLKWEGLQQEKPSHEDCYFVRQSLKMKGICDDCELGKVLDKLEKEMRQLSDGAKALEDAARHDYYSR